MRLQSYLLCWTVSLLSLSVHGNSLQQTIDELIQNTLPQATVGVLVQTANSGQTLYQHNANKLLMPASNIKLLSAAAALYHLGPEYRYQTTISKFQNNIYVTFGGDPSLTSVNFVNLIKQLPSKNIKTISGNFVFDTTRFQPPDHPNGSSYDDIGWYYNAPSGSIMLDENAVEYEFIGAPKFGKPIQIKAIKADSPITLINKVVTATPSEEKSHCGLHVKVMANNTLYMYGCLAQSGHPIRMKLAIPDPSLYAKNILKQTVKRDRIILKGSIKEGMTPAKATLIASHQSAPLAMLVKHMLEESDNLYADSITKLLGYSLTGQGTYQQGAFAIQTILLQHHALDAKQWVLSDGLGTRYNMITPKQLVFLLQNIYQNQQIHSDFLNALPRMGVSGSLKDRMKETTLVNKVFAKTGSMHDISALSGYLITPADKTLVFSIIINGISDNLGKARTLQEKILLAISSQSEET